MLSCFSKTRYVSCIFPAFGKMTNSFAVLMAYSCTWIVAVTQKQRTVLKKIRRIKMVYVFQQIVNAFIFWVCRPNYSISTHIQDLSKDNHMISCVTGGKQIQQQKLYLPFVASFIFFSYLLFINEPHFTYFLLELSKISSHLLQGPKM